MQLFHFHHCKRHLKKRTLALDPLPPPPAYAVYARKNDDNYGRPLSDVLPMLCNCNNVLQHCFCNLQQYDCNRLCAHWRNNTTCNKSALLLLLLLLELCPIWPVTPPTLLELCRAWPAVTPLAGCSLGSKSTPMLCR